MTSRPRRDPREAALDVLAEHWTDADGRVTFPVDPVRIAESIGVEVVRANLERDVSGLLVKDPKENSARIFLNRRDHERRQRFTCAHEIGHLTKRGPDVDERIGYVDSRDTLASAGTDPEEIWANGFAAELLMPAVAVRTLWAKGTSVPKIARTFGVSEEAMQVRLATLRLS
jgi:Zn-dependent peptidase ImmA (M78 family)